MAAPMPHEGYKPDITRGSDNDILVLKTDRPFQLNHNVRVIPLADTGHDPKGRLILKFFASRLFFLSPLSANHQNFFEYLLTSF